MNEETKLMSEKEAQIIALFNETRSSYSSGTIDQEAERRLNAIINAFDSFNSEKGREGVIYASKGLAIIFHRRALTIEGVKEKIVSLEKAHDTINETVTKARKFNKLQPSLLKHQVAIKSDLAEILHTTGDHYNAKLIEKSAGMVAAEMRENFPDYAEGFVTVLSASYKKLKWMMSKMLWDLGRTESLLKKPVHTKHRVSPDEVHQYMQDIQKMRATINSISQIIN